MCARKFVEMEKDLCYNAMMETEYLEMDAAQIALSNKAGLAQEALPQQKIRAYKSQILHQ